MYKILCEFSKLIPGILALTVCISSCSENEAIQKQVADTYSNSNGKEQAHVNFIGQWKTEGKRETIVRDFVREYSFLNQELYVNLKFPEEIGFDRYNQTSTLNFIENILQQPIPEWDVILINDNVEGIGAHLGDENWAKTHLVDFNEYQELTKNTIPEINLEKVKQRWGGIIPGPFLEGQYWALWTNINVTKKLGIEVKQHGMTVDDFISYIKAVDQYNRTNSVHITPFQEASDWATAFTVAINMYISQFNSFDDLYTDQITEQKLEAWHKTLKVLEQLSTYNMIDNDWSTIVWSDTKIKLLNEECLFYSNGSWMYNIWAIEDEARVMNCVPNEYPTFNKPLLYPAGYPIMWGVLKKAPNKEQAIKFLLAMNQPTMADSWVRNTKSPTGIKGNLAETSFGSDQFENFSKKIQVTYGSNTYVMHENSSLIFNQKLTNEPNYFMDVLTGKLSADEAILRIKKSLANEI